MNEFYESILNIRKCDKKVVIENIFNIVLDELDDVTSYVNNMEGLCKVLSNNVKCRLDEEKISNKIINIKDLGTDVEHEFIIANFKDLDNKINYILIDPTYRQFLKREGKPLHFDEWPSTLLEESNSELLESLLNLGFSEINSESFKNYINSFGINYEFEDVILDKGDINETNFKNNKKR